MVIVFNKTGGRPEDEAAESSTLEKQWHSTIPSFGPFFGTNATNRNSPWVKNLKKRKKEEESTAEKKTRWFLLASEAAASGKVSPVKQGWQIHLKDVLKCLIFPNRSRIDQRHHVINVISSHLPFQRAETPTARRLHTSSRVPVVVKTPPHHHHLLAVSH